MDSEKYRLDSLWPLVNREQHSRWAGVGARPRTLALGMGLI